MYAYVTNVYIYNIILLMTQKHKLKFASLKNFKSVILKIFVKDFNTYFHFFL